MRQIQKFPLLTVKQKSVSIFAGIGVLFLASMSAGCGLFVKRTKIEMPKAVLQAKSASLDELLQVVNRNDAIRSLQARFEAKYTAEKKGTGLIELARYPRVPGYILLKRPDSIYLDLKYPVFGGGGYTILSVGDDFSVWDHRKGILYRGKNSAKELISDDLDENHKISIRAPHIFEAILPSGIPARDPDLRYSVVEEEVAEKDIVVAKYYILSLYRNSNANGLQPLRKFWIERSGLTISRQLVYNENGGIVSDIVYSNPVQIGEFSLPCLIHIRRPEDGYSFELEFKKSDWKLNPVFKDGTFELQSVPDGVRIIQFK